MAPLIAGILLLAVTLAIRAASINRHVRGRLFVSALVFGLYAVGGAVLRYAAIDAELAQQLRLVGPLLLTFGSINALVALAINPLRGDQLPDRFPTIVQDTIVIGLFAIGAVVILQERIFAATAVGAVVIGFALQDTLGNLFAGLAIQIEKPFRVGHWVNVGGRDGLVGEITWRATKIRTRAGNFIVVPNSVIARDSVTNYSQPTMESRIDVEVGASYETSPNDVKAVILDTLKDEPLLARDRHPTVAIADFAASAITYRVMVWIDDYTNAERVHDAVRSRIYYAFRRNRITIPFPIQVQIEGNPEAPAVADPGRFDAVMERVDIFVPLTAAQRSELRASARPYVYAAGETIVRQGDPGGSMFVLVRGEASVTLDSSRAELARLTTGSFFGEMSVLTGEPRTATVRAVIDCELLEISVDAFRQFLLANPTVVDRLGHAVATRRSEIDQRRAADATQMAVEAPHTFIARMRRFLHLTT